MSYSPDDAEGLRRQLARVRRGMAALLVQGSDYTEMHRQLEVRQRQVVRLYFRAARGGLLPAWIPLPADGDPEPALLPEWERLARALETDGRLPKVDEISDMRVPIIGEDRLEHRSPPERTPLWIQHAVQLVELLIDYVKPARPPATDGKRAGEPATDPELAEHLKPSHARAKALYEWAIEHIDGSEDMTYADLFEKLMNHPHCDGEGLPGNAATFARYCRAAGVRRNTPRHEKGATRSVRRVSDL